MVCRADFAARIAVYNPRTVTRVHLVRGQTSTACRKVLDAARDNAFLFAIVALGLVILGIGYAPPYAEAVAVLGAAFIICRQRGIYMMLATRQVARKLHERFNEQNNILREMASSQKETTLTLKGMADALKGMADTLKRIEQKLT